MISKIKALPEVARAVTREVLETMFFVTAEPVECDHERCGGNCATAMVRFDGSPRGELRVTLSRELAAPIACGFLGIEADEVTREEQNQITCELANMICGAVLSRLHPDCRVALNAPEMIRPRPGDTAAHEVIHDAMGTHQCFETPDGMLAVTMIAQP